MSISILELLKRGLKRHCPQCGSPGLFQGYLTINRQCQNCQLDFETIRSDDAPAYFTIAIVGHIILPLISIVEFTYSLEFSTHCLLWLPLTSLLTLTLLPHIKGVVMAMLWKIKYANGSS